MSGQLELPLGSRGEAPSAQRSAEGGKRGRALGNRPPDGRGGRAPQYPGGAEARPAEPGQSRYGRDDGGGTAEASGRERGGPPGTAAGGHLPAKAGETATHPEARRRGVRELGIPCVLDRLIQQAILQVL